MAKLRSVVCAGSSGGGKTTLARELHARLPANGDLNLLTWSRPGAAARAMGYEKPSAVPPEQMGAFQWYALFTQIQAEQNLQRFIADRGVLDFLAYAMYQAPSVNEDYAKIARREAEKYDLIVVVPPNSKGTEDNGIRHLHGVQEVHHHLCEAIDHFGLYEQTIFIEADDPVSRAHEVITELARRNYLTADGKDWA